MAGRTVKDGWRIILATYFLLGVAGGSRGQTAGEVLLSAGQRRELKTLTGQLADPQRSAKTKREAAGLLLTRPYPQAAEALRRFLADAENRAAQIAIARAVAEAGAAPAALVEPLMALLQSDDPAARQAAGRALVTYKDHGVTKRLIALARGAEGAAGVRLEAIRALSNLLDRDVVDALVQLLDAQEAQVRQAAAEGLAQITNIRAFGADRARWHQWWRQNRDKPRSEWLADLADNLARAKARLESENAQLRERLARAMQDLHAATPPAGRDALLVSFLKDPLAEVRVVGASLVERRLAAGEDVAPAVREQVRALLDDPEQRVRRQAALLLANLRDEPAAALLRERLRKEESPAVRAALLTALGQVGTAEALPAILEQVAAEGELAAAAARALGQLAARRPLEGQDLQRASAALRERYEAARADEDANGAATREALLSALGALRDPAALPVLRGALAEAAAVVRLAAINALAGFGNGHDEAARIAPLTADPDRGVRQAALRALGALGAREHLDTVLARTDPSLEADAAVREQAWTVAMNALAEADAATLGRVAEALAERPEARQQRIRVLELLVTALEKAASDELPGARRRLGLALMEADRPAEAAGHLRRAHGALAERKDPAASAVWGEWVRALLAAGDPSVAGVLAARPADETFAAARTALLEHIGQDHVQQRWPQVLALSEAALETLDGRLSEAQTAQLTAWRNEARTQRRQADRRRVAELAPRLVGPKDEAAKAAEALQTMGERARAPLAEQLERIVRAEQANPALEKAVADLLGRLAPDFDGYDPAAPRDARLQHIAAWRKKNGQADT